MEQVKISVKLCFIGNELNRGRSIYSYRLSYASKSIRECHGEKYCRKFTPWLLVYMFGWAKTIQLNDIGKLTMKFCFVWNELKGSCLIYPQKCNVPVAIYGTSSFVL